MPLRILPTRATQGGSSVSAWSRGEGPLPEPPLFSRTLRPSPYSDPGAHRPCVAGVREPAFDSLLNVNPQFLDRVWKSSKKYDWRADLTWIGFDQCLHDVQELLDTLGSTSALIAANPSGNAPPGYDCIAIVNPADERYTPPQPGWHVVTWKPLVFQGEAWLRTARFLFLRLAGPERRVTVTNGEPHYLDYAAYEHTRCLNGARVPSDYTILMSTLTPVCGAFVSRTTPLSDRVSAGLVAAMVHGGNVYSMDEQILALDRWVSVAITLPRFMSCDYPDALPDTWHGSSFDTCIPTTLENPYIYHTDVATVAHWYVTEAAHWGALDPWERMIYSCYPVPGSDGICDRSHPVLVARARRLSRRYARSAQRMNAELSIYKHGRYRLASDTTDAEALSSWTKVAGYPVMPPTPDPHDHSPADVYVAGVCPSSGAEFHLMTYQCARDQRRYEAPNEAWTCWPGTLGPDMPQACHPAPSAPEIILDTSGVELAPWQPEARMAHSALAMATVLATCIAMFGSQGFKAALLSMLGRATVEVLPLLALCEAWVWFTVRWARLPQHSLTRAVPDSAGFVGHAHRTATVVNRPQLTAMAAHRAAIIPGGHAWPTDDTGLLAGLLRLQAERNKFIMPSEHKASSDFCDSMWSEARRVRPGPDCYYRAHESWPCLREPCLNGLYFTNPLIATSETAPIEPGTEFLQYLDDVLKLISTEVNSLPEGYDQWTLTASYQADCNWLPGHILSLEAAHSKAEHLTAVRHETHTIIRVALPGGSSRALAMMRLIPWVHPAAARLFRQARVRVLNGRPTDGVRLDVLRRLECAYEHEAVSVNAHSWAPWMLNCASAPAGKLSHLYRRFVKALLLAGHVYGTDEAILADQFVVSMQLCPNPGAQAQIPASASIACDARWVQFDMSGQLTNSGFQPDKITRSMAWPAISRAALNRVSVHRPNQTVAILTVGTRGDRTTPAYWARSLRELGIRCDLVPLHGISSGLAMLRSVEDRNAPGALQHLILAERRAKLVQAYYDVVFAPSGLPAWPGLTYTMAPTLWDALPATGPYEGWAGLMVGAFSALHGPDIHAGWIGPSGIPRSTDGDVPLMTYRIAPGPAGKRARAIRAAWSGATFLVKGSSSVQPPSRLSTLPVLGNRDHAQAGVLIGTILHSGSAGVAYTFARQGCQVLHWDRTHDRGWWRQPSRLGSNAFNFCWDIALLARRNDRAADLVMRPCTWPWAAARLRVLTTRVVLFMPVVRVLRTAWHDGAYLSPTNLATTWMRAWGFTSPYFIAEVVVGISSWYLGNRFGAGLIRAVAVELIEALEHKLWPLVALIVGPVPGTLLLALCRTWVEEAHRCGRLFLYTLAGVTRRVPRTGTWLTVRVVSGTGIFVHTSIVFADTGRRDEGVFQGPPTNIFSFGRPMRHESAAFIPHPKEFYIPAPSVDGWPTDNETSGWGPFHNCVTLTIRQLAVSRGGLGLMVVLVFYMILITPLTITAVVVLGMVAVTQDHIHESSHRQEA